jgi:hypothetical protein
MKLWEGAILVVGGIWLVSYMASKNAVVQATAGAASAASSAGVSNSSNLTTITNTAGGQPTVMGEPLEPPQAPITGTPYTGTTYKRRVGTSTDSPFIVSRPMAVHL